MARMISFVMVLALVAPACAQSEKPVVGSGVIVTETRELADFDAIELHMSGDVRVSIGKAMPFEISGEDNILPLIKTEVRDRRLIISVTKPFKTKHSPDIELTIPDIESAAIHGSGDMDIGRVDGKSLKLAVHGSGDLRCEGKTEQLTVRIAGSGDVRLNGVAEQLLVEIRGSGDVHGFDCKASNVSVTIHGSGDARVHAIDALNVVIHGSGDVQYKGNPQVNQVIKGSGDVVRRK